jgi:hypothetical protein
MNSSRLGRIGAAPRTPFLSEAEPTVNNLHNTNFAQLYKQGIGQAKFNGRIHFQCSLV